MGIHISMPEGRRDGFVAACPLITGFDLGGRDAILRGMNAILRHLIETAESWPEEDQNELVAYAREIEARRQGVYVLSDEERAAIEEGLAEADRGELLEIDDVFREFLPELK